jgi:argonaute-like protein implicated in RNA metabolism and viral defense
MHSARLYCSNGGCCAWFDAEGNIVALAAAFCPYCGCQLETAVDAYEGVASEDPGASTQPLELRVVQGPVSRL